MRPDMSRVIVERPRRDGVDRRGRALPFEDLPQCEGMRRPHFRAGGAKELNENLSPLRRYLERQVGRPWDKVYAEIAEHLCAGNTVQQHVRDHLRDFVAIKPRRRHGWYFTYPGEGKEPFSWLWYQPLYVDEKDGILKRTDRLPEEKARQRARRNPPLRPLDRVALAADRELCRIEGFWYELRLVPMPYPVYRAVVDRRKVPLKAYRSAARSSKSTSPSAAWPARLCEMRSPAILSRSAPKLTNRAHGPNIVGATPTGALCHLETAAQ